MSEQEKTNAIPTEGTVTEVQDERSWLKKFVDKHPKAWKWVKRIGCGIGIGGGLFCAFEAGKACGGKQMAIPTIAEGTVEPAEDELENNDVFEE